MKLVINHLTRLKPGYICVAGLNLDDYNQVRPVIPYSLITRRFLVEERGGVFGIGQQADLGPVRHVGKYPEIEDYSFEPGKIQLIGQSDPAIFWQQLERTAHPALADIFGPGLQLIGQTLTFPENHGMASLGNWRPAGSLQIGLDERDTLRLNISDPDHELSLPVTDLRFYESDHKTLKPAIIEQVGQWLADPASSVILSVGLSRPWQKSGDTIKRHWLQLNNFHFQHQPVW